MSQKKVFCLKPSEYPMLLPKANPRDMLPKYLSAYPIDIPTQHASETKVTHDETQQGKKWPSCCLTSGPVFKSEPGALHAQRTRILGKI